MCKALFLAFDASKTVHHTRKFLFEGHLVLAHKDYRICHMDEYISPMKVSDGITLQVAIIICPELNFPYPSIQILRPLLCQCQKSAKRTEALSYTELVRQVENPQGSKAGAGY